MFGTVALIARRPVGLIDPLFVPRPVQPCLHKNVLGAVPCLVRSGAAERPYRIASDPSATGDQHCNEADTHNRADCLPDRAHELTACAKRIEPDSGPGRPAAAAPAIRTSAAAAAPMRYNFTT
jgi:hypothetical protein